MHMKMPEPIGTYLPRPSAARLNIAPHMTDVHAPQRTANIIESGTLMFCCTETPATPITSVLKGSSTNLTGAYMAASISAMPATAQNVTMTLELTLPPMTPPTMRPHIIRNQYTATTEPATAAPTYPGPFLAIPPTTGICSVM